MASEDLIQKAMGLVEAFNRSDWDAWRSAMAEDSVYDEAGTSRRLAGHAAVISALQGWKKAMPDVTGTVTNALASGKTVVLEVTWKGTHTGPLEGPSGTVAATGKPQTTRSGWVMEYDGGKLKSSRHYFDMLSFLQQLGVLSS